MFDGRWRTQSDRILQPIGVSLKRAGVAADQLTIAGLVLSGVAAVLIGMGELRWGVAALVASALTDVLDGSVAKAAGTAGPRGAFFDSVADRISDALLLGGVAWYFVGAHSGRTSLLPVAVLAASFIVSYERAKAESLGFTARGGVMERMERIVVLAIGLFFEAILIAVLWLMLGLTVFTVIQRFFRVWGQATEASGSIPDVGRWQLGRWRGRRIARPTARTLRRRSASRR
jgi:CDP-diacylglycerol--glycerol-3-phosphate 3-phosphatidyltransferase